MWGIRGTLVFDAWFDHLTESEREVVIAKIDLLRDKGPQLRMPHSSRIVTSRHGHIRELRIQHSGRPYRVLYAFDPRRAAILLLGGDKTGRDRWYEVSVPIADRLYDEHLAELRSKEPD